MVATSLASVNATLASLRNIELAVSLGLLVALLILMTVLIRLGLRPLEDMSREADAIAAGDLTRRVQPTEGDGEIARLGRALNGMLTQIETAFAQRAGSEERLRSFLADASHELRTPLTSIQGYAELLRKDALATGEERDRALARIEKEAARMGALVGRSGRAGPRGPGSRAGPGPGSTWPRWPPRWWPMPRPSTPPVASSSPHRGRSRWPGMTPGWSSWSTTCSGTPWPTPRPGTPVEVGVSVHGHQAVLRVARSGSGAHPRAGQPRVRPLLPGRCRSPGRRVGTGPVHRGQPGPHLRGSGHRRLHRGSRGPPSR